MTGKMSEEHLKLVKRVLNLYSGILDARQYSKLFLVSRPTALKRMRLIAKKTDLECYPPEKGVRRKTTLVNERITKGVY